MSEPVSPSSARELTPPPPSDPSPLRTETPQQLPLAIILPPTMTTTATVTTAVVPTPATSTNPRRLPPPCWSHDETVALIDAYRDKWYSLRRGNLKATHWQEVADAVANRCPAASPAKTAVQCRHKMEKLRKRYRTEIQRARSMPISVFSSSWVHFKGMDAMEKGPVVKVDDKSDSQDEDNEEEDDDDHHEQGLYNGAYNNNNNGTPFASKNVQRFYNGNGMAGTSGRGGGSGSSSSGGFRIRIPTGVSIAQPGPRYYGKIDQKYTVNPNSNEIPNLKPNFGAGFSYGGSRGMRPLEEMGRSSGKRGRENARDSDRDPIGEMVLAIKMLGDGFVKMEQMKMEMAREIEGMRMEMEMKRTEMLLESQQRIVESFANAFCDNNKKKSKRMPPSPEA